MKAISTLLTLFLPNILIGGAIAVLIVGIIDRVYLFNFLKLLQLQAETKANQQQITVLTRNLTTLVTHQPVVEAVNADEQLIEQETGEPQLPSVDQSTSAIKIPRLSQNQVDQMVAELQASQELNGSPAQQLKLKLEVLQRTTALFFKTQVVNENGKVIFETPLADEPDKIRAVAQASTVQALRQLRLMVQREKIFSKTLTPHFLDFLTFYETVASALLQVNANNDAKLTTLLMTYQDKISMLLQLQAGEDYQYNTLLYWQQQLTTMA